MLRPCQPVEGRRPDRFRPPHCPRARCIGHRIRHGFRYKKCGSYRCKASGRRRIQRFACKLYGHTFSQQSFACTYYMKRPELLIPIAAGLVAGSAHRQIARTLGCAPSTVTRLAARIGRHTLLLQALALAQLDEIGEPIVFDHFETFVFSQDDRLGIGTAVGQRSWFVYTMDPAPHRRAGRRSARRAPPRRPLPDRIPGSVVRSTRRVIRLLCTLAHGKFEMVSDDHPSYTAAIRSLPQSSRPWHRVYRNPERRTEAGRVRARERDREMFPVDLLHKLWRHTQAHQRRETIAFGRRSNAVLERAALMAVWRNFVKGVSERRNDPTTPAMRLALTEAPYSWHDVFAKRLFPGRIRLPKGWARIYRREWITPAVGRNTRHRLVHAY